MNQEIANIFHENNSDIFSLLVSGSSYKFNNKMFDTVMKFKVPIILIDPGDAMSNAFWSSIKINQRVLSKPEKFNLKEEDFLEYIENTLEICQCTPLEISQAISYLQFLAYIESELTGKDTKVKPELMEKYRGISSVTQALQEIFNRGLIDKNQKKAMLEEYGEFCVIAPLLQQLTVLIDFQNSLVVAKNSKETDLYYLKLKITNKRQSQLQYALIKHCLKDLQGYQILILETSNHDKSGIFDLMAILKQKNHVALFSENLFIGRDDVEIDAILDIINHRFLGKHFAKSQKISDLFGQEITYQTIVASTKDRSIKRNTITDRIFGLNVTKTVSSAPVEFARYPVSAIQTLDDDMAIYAGPKETRYIQLKEECS